MSRALRVLSLAALVLLVRATSPPTADAAGVTWARPVAGGVVRSFAYDSAKPFVRGGHRGADLAAAPGVTVRAACGGRVVTARPSQVVTLRCGPWRVTHLPMAHVTVHAGQRVAPGARLGTLGTSAAHSGLHLGVRAAGDRFAYVDPLPFLPPAGRPRLLPPLPISRATRHPHTPPARVPERPRALRPAAPRLPQPVPSSRRVSATAVRRSALHPHPVAPAARRVVPSLVRGVRVPSATGLAPWPAWAGLAMVLCGALLGGGVRWRARTRRVRAPAGAREGVA